VDFYFSISDLGAVIDRAQRCEMRKVPGIDSKVLCILARFVELNALLPNDPGRFIIVSSELSPLASDA